MSPDSQRIAIAEACGWKVKRRDITGYNVWEPDAEFPAQLANNIENKLPNYLADLNAMHEAEETLQESQRGTYSDELYDLAVEHQLKTGKWRYLSMTASQRAEAFLRTIGKWEDAK